MIKVIKNPIIKSFEKIKEKNIDNWSVENGLLSLVRVYYKESDIYIAHILKYGEYSQHIFIMKSNGIYTKDRITVPLVDEMSLDYIPFFEII